MNEDNLTSGTGKYGESCGDSFADFSLNQCPSLDLISSVLKYSSILNRDLTVRSISPDMAQELGWESEEALGRDFLQLIDDPKGEFHGALTNALNPGEERFSAGMMYRKGKGPARCIPVEIVPFDFAGERKIFIYMDNSFELRSVLEWERDERVKELKCLYLLGSAMEAAHTIDELLLNTSGYISNAMQFTDICDTAITLDGKEFSHLRRDGPIMRTLEIPLFVRGRKRGRILVKYHRDESFISEETALVSSISKMLGRAAERFELDRQRALHLMNLEAQVQDRVKELEKSRSRYKNLFDNAPSGISISTMSGEIVTANHAFYRMLKYPGDREGSAHIIHDQLYCDPKERDSLLALADKQGRVSDYEFNLRAMDGSIITVSCSTTRFEEEGQVLYESIIKDITERKILERKLRKQKERLEDMVRKRTEVLERQRNKLMSMNRRCKDTSAELRSNVKKMQTLFNAITDRVFSADVDNNIQMTNQSPDDIGKKCYQVLFGRDRPCENCPAVRAKVRKKPASLEIERGDSFYQLRCYPILDSSGNVEGIIEWVKDITRDKNFCNQMLQADRLASLGQLVSGIGHEINNPNTFILGNMKIIHEAVDDIMPILDQYYESRPELKIARLKYSFFKQHIGVLIDDMASGAERIKTIIQDLKKFARKSEDRFDNNISVNHLVERSIRLVRSQVKRKAEISTNLAENLPLIRANSVGLEQVLVNLIINAYDALKEGEKGKIHISTAADETGDNIIIRVSDDGVGMDETTIRKIFDPFYTTKRSRGGTGLGLSIAYRIIKEHDGEVDVESNPGTGTTFVIEIPVKKTGYEA